MKVFKKITGIVLVLCMVVSAFGMTAFAADENWEKSEDSTNPVTVNATVVPSFTVTIPKTIVLAENGAGSNTYTKNLTINVKGDIGEAQTLSVTPSDTISLAGAEEAAGQTAEASVTKGKVAFARADLLANEGAGTTVDHAIAVDLTPGTWSGTINVTVALSNNE